MKKTSIIAIALIYLVAVILVGFMGIKMKVYDPVIYAEKIVWNSTEFENNKQFKVEKNKETLVSQGVEADAKLEYVTMSFDEPITLNIKCYCEPLNATNAKLDYYFDNSGINYVGLKILDDNTCNLTFEKAAAFTLFVKTTDGRAITYSIRINISLKSTI